ncbi:MAG: cytochrome b/b6 domain-containing protein [Desulfobulbaceae bacterium]|nr:MAG: cytochrome b/b6 domain-containing protein [Desulfobulbaceae bacterium]
MKYLVRHSIVVRITHWLVAVSGILLLFSGFGQLPMYMRYNVVKIPGLAWSSNYEITLLIHYISGAVFTAAIFFHIVYHLKRKEFAIVPRPNDLSESVTGLLAMFGLKEEPRHEKFQAKQRVIYAIFALFSTILIATGLIKSFKNLGPIVLEPMLLQWIAFTHTIAGGIFLLLVVAHVGALLLKNHRPLIPSMFTGKIDAEYARHHHPEWRDKA